MSLSARELLARRVRELRREKGWSQEDLAVASNLHRTYIGTVERAEQSITVDSIEKLATALEVPVAKLFEL
ncbi:MAG: helix-turn-helix transcriptional regulator [Thiohalophilus sp.]|uniref:helix-turn-helix domain-containing protein n=1 Tax=Thiohalophilus sp. TaxID=3028392 RepID=UPI0028706F8A|nr:helix-turn-helix transcriptional regulator [Thiohalophilus sp.]MDR9437194.1 helix-turn-helix transcriptional regulator [Thiohalophilus sp.]